MSVSAIPVSSGLAKREAIPGVFRHAFRETHLEELIASELAELADVRVIIT